MNTVFFRNGKKVGGHRKTDQAMDWQLEVRRYAWEAMNGRGLITGPVEVIWTAIFARKGKPAKTKDRPREWKTTKPDADKIERLIFDGLSDVVFVDDNQVARHHGQKFIGYQGREGTWSEPGHTIIAVRLLSEIPARQPPVEGALPGMA